MQKLVKLEDIYNIINESQSGDNIKVTDLLEGIENIPKISKKEDLEKALPYKVGDTIWELSYIWDDPCVKPYKITTSSKLFLIDKNLGRLYFLTKEEAEEKLKKVVNREYD